MATDKKKSDTQIAALLDQHIRFTTGFSDSKLSKERERILRYYDGELPAPTHKGNSKYVSQDVFESVESLKATILEVFSTNKQIVSFNPSGPNDVEASRIATEYCSYLVFRRNPGLDILTDVLDDGLLARAGIVQFTWEDEDEETEDSIGPATMDELAAHPDIADEKTSVDSVDDHEDGTFTANVTKRKNKGYVCLDVVPPEDFGITARARDVKSAKLVWRRETKTKGELLSQGHSKKLVDSLPSENTEMALDTEKLSRFHQTDDNTFMTDDSADLDSEGRSHLIYHCYAKMDVEGTGIAKLWYICKCAGIILKKYKVSMRPFAVFTPLRKAHSFYGNSFAAKVLPIQNVRSVLTRSILDHAVITNSPRYKVVKGGLMDPKELMDNRIGGVVNVTRPDGVMPLEQAPLNPFIFQTLQMMDQAKEDTTGVSRLSKGLNREAVSTQNSRGLVEDLVSLSDRRAKLIARRFAGFLEELYLGIYQLVLDHQDYTEALEVAGNWVTVDPKAWRERTMCTAEIKVGYGELEKEAEELVQIDQYLSQNPAMYGPEQKYHVTSQALIKKGYKDVSNYIIPPDKQQPPPPNPEMEAKVALAQSQAKAAEMQAQTALLHVQLEGKKWEHDFQLKTHKEAGQHAIKSDAQTLKERQEVHREMVDAAEIELQRKELEMAQKVQATSFAHPNG